MGKLLPFLLNLGWTPWLIWPIRYSRSDHKKPYSCHPEVSECSGSRSCSSGSSLNALRSPNHYRCSYQQSHLSPHRQSALIASHVTIPFGMSSHVKLQMTIAPTKSWLSSYKRLQVRPTHLSPANLQNQETLIHSCFKLLCFGLLCYIAIDNQNRAYRNEGEGKSYIKDLW